MSNAAAIEEAVANGWLDQEDVQALGRKLLVERLMEMELRDRFYKLPLEEKCAMIREMIWDRKGRYE